METVETTAKLKRIWAAELGNWAQQRLTNTDGRIWRVEKGLKNGDGKGWKIGTVEVTAKLRKTGPEQNGGGGD